MGPIADPFPADPFAADPFAAADVLGVADSSGVVIGWTRASSVSGMAVPTTEESVQRIRDLCLAQPGATERESHGEPSWFVGKQFLTVADRHHDDRVAFWAAAPDGAQEHWIALDAGRFFRPPYVGGRGWIGVYLDVEQDWDDIAEIVAAAHEAVAPPRLRRAP